MQIDAALLKEQGVTFAVVAVKQHVLNNTSEAFRVQQGFQAFFPGCPIILMAQDIWDTPTYYGRPDIVRFLSNIPVINLPWKRFTFN